MSRQGRQYKEAHRDQGQGQGASTLYIPWLGVGELVILEVLSLLWSL